MNFSAIKTLLRISFLVIVIACFVECFVIGPAKNAANEDFPSYSNAVVGFGGKKKEECAYQNITIGKKQDGQLLMVVEKLEKGSSMFHKTTTGMTYPSGNQKNNCVFTQIIVQNLDENQCNTDKCIKKEIIKINSGGPGYTFFNLSITAGANCPNYHKIFGFTNCGTR